MNPGERDIYQITNHITSLTFIKYKQNIAQKKNYNNLSGVKKHLAKLSRIIKVWSCI